LHQCIRPLTGVRCAPGHHGYQRACDLISGQASTGHLGHQCSHAPGRPNLHLVSSSRRPRQVRNIGLHHLALLIFRFASVVRRSSSLGDCVSEHASLEAPATSQNAPGDTSQLIGERDRQHVMVQPFLGRLDPGLEPVALPALRLDQYNARRLNKQNPQGSRADTALASLYPSRMLAFTLIPGQLGNVG